MKISINKNFSEAKWFTMKQGEIEAEDDPQFLIRPFPNSLEEFVGRHDGSIVLTGSQLFEKFNYCLVDWKNVLDDEGRQIPISQEVKKVIYDNALGGIPAFVSNRISKLAEERNSNIKN